MPVLVIDSKLEKKLKAQRARSGANRYDEVWEGVYVMAPLPNNEHQALVAALTTIFQEVVGWNGTAGVYPGVNVSDRQLDWKKNYRCPDVVVVYPGGRAKDLGTHWLGGPDFVVEIVSRGDRSRKKAGFYSRLGVREQLRVERSPWRLELYRLVDSRLELSGQSTVDNPSQLVSEVLPLSFRLVAGSARPLIEVASLQDGKTWHV